jgi:hypothetical protein
MANSTQPKPIQPPVNVAAAPPTAAATPERPKCTVEMNSDGSAYVTFRLDGDVLKRHQRRAHTQDLGEYLWANVIRAAVESSVY